MNRRSWANRYVSQVGEAQTGDAGDAEDDPGVETGTYFCFCFSCGASRRDANSNAEGPWSWVEEVAEIIDTIMRGGRRRGIAV